MLRKNRIDEMMSAISGNIEHLERELQEEYKMLFRISSDFEDIAADFILLDRKFLSQVEKEYETTSIVDRLHARISTTFGPEADTLFIMEAAMAVMDENSSAAAMSRN